MIDGTEYSEGREAETLALPAWIEKHPLLAEFVRFHNQNLLASSQKNAAEIHRRIFLYPDLEGALKETLIGRRAPQDEEAPLPLPSAAGIRAQVKGLSGESATEFLTTLNLPEDDEQDTYRARLGVFSALLCEAARIAALPIVPDIERLFDCLGRLQRFTWRNDRVVKAEALLLEEAEER